uniref:Paralemmin 3 n=1 Tax=Sinocyclocheilus rhinocerous TaxID=307959 RepID=A0A673IZX2_9TELE
RNHSIKYYQFCDIFCFQEKRRIQEEQERARREIEDERLRLQQLKRKSLRDQWLMEGPPASPDSTGPRSPLWGPKVQEMETHINKLQVTSEQLAEEESKLKKLIEDGSNQTGTDAQTQHKVRHHAEEAGTLSDVTTETDTTTTSAALNGNEEHASANGFNSHPAEGLGAGGVTMTFLGFKEVELGQGVDEDDDGGAIIRAERIIITDEGEEIPEEDDETAQEPTTETKDLQDLEEEEKDSTDMQPQNVTVDGAIEASHVPMYSTTQPSPKIRPKVEANTTESQTPKDEEVTPAMRISLSQFQEVPLDGAGETAESNTKAETEKQRAEQEPLLVSKAAAQLETSTPNRAEDASAPKQKACQCCSIM